MSSRSAKGSAMEKMLHDELKAYYAKQQGFTLMAEWRVIRNRYSNQDFLGAWDTALLYARKWKGKYDMPPLIVLAQVKSDHRPKLITHLSKLYTGAGILGYYATYGKKPNARIAIKLPHFYLIEVCR